MSDAPAQVLVVTSLGSPGSAVVPVLAALEAAGHKVRAIDVGRLGSPSDGTVGRVLKAFSAEFAERRLARELASHPPKVAIGFDPGSVKALAEARDEALQPAPVVAVVPELTPGPAWGHTNADRYLTVDDEAAVVLSDAGLPGDRVLAVGPMCEIGYAAAARNSRDSLREKFKLPRKAAIVVVEVDGLGYDTTSQVVLQLSLLGDSNTVYLFAAGDDVDAASALRRQVPTLDMKAKLFGNTPDAPLYWRAADVVVARPRASSVARALVLNIKMVCFSPEEGGGEHLANAMVERGVGALAKNPLLISSALEPLLSSAHRPSNRTATDGAANVADVVTVIAKAAKDVIDESKARGRDAFHSRVDAAASSAEASARISAVPGELEDLGGGSFSSLFDDEPEVDDGEISRVRAELSAKMGELSRTVNNTQKSVERWEKKLSAARKQGDDDLARKIERNLDLERARMHQSLAEMAQMEGEMRRVEKARAAKRPRPSSGNRPSARSGSGTSSRRRDVNDRLREMKNKSKASVDDELERLKKKMKKRKGKK